MQKDQRGQKVTLSTVTQREAASASSHKMIRQTNLCMNPNVFIFGEMGEHISSKPAFICPALMPGII